MQQRLTTETFALLNSMAAVAATTNGVGSGVFDSRRGGVFGDQLRTRSSPLSVGCSPDRQFAASSPRSFWNGQHHHHHQQRRRDDNDQQPHVQRNHQLPVDVEPEVAARRTTPHLIRDILGLRDDDARFRQFPVSISTSSSPTTADACGGGSFAGGCMAAAATDCKSLKLRPDNDDVIGAWNAMTTDMTSAVMATKSSAGMCFRSVGEDRSASGLEHRTASAPADTTLRGMLHQSYISK